MVFVIPQLYVCGNVHGLFGILYLRVEAKGVYDSTMRVILMVKGVPYVLYIGWICGERWLVTVHKVVQYTMVGFVRWFVVTVL